MKTGFLALFAFTFAAFADLHGQNSSPAPDATTPAAPAADAQREEATGTITDVMPERSLVLHTGTNAGAPLVLRFAPEVTYVDEDGKILQTPGLRKNLRVRVSYLKSGGDHIIDKVTILP